MRLAFVYVGLALVATAANLLSQALWIEMYNGPYAVTLSIGIGTGVGLLLKYVLDKRYIFRYQARDLRHDSQMFMLYTLMGAFTTLLFWGVECGFYAAFGTAYMRYFGGLLGLAIGYVVKYQLDKRYVFSPGKAT